MMRILRGSVVKSITRFTACLISLLVLLTGCFAFPLEDPVLPPPITPPRDPRPYRTGIVARGDVFNATNPVAIYIPARVERVFFSVPGHFIKGVYVSVGDVVQAGDIIAELDRPALAASLESARRDEEWALLDIAQAHARHDRLLAEAAVTGQPVDDTAILQEIANLNANMENIQARIEYLLRQDYLRFVRASIDGIVTQVINVTEGMRSDGLLADSSPQLPVATITDQSRTVFRVISAEADLMEPGDRFPIIIGNSEYNGLVVDPVEFGITRTDPLARAAYLTVPDAVPAMGALTLATVRVVHDYSLDTLYVPLLAVNRSGPRSFVFLLDGETRVARDVELGIRGSIHYEIISGLYEGEVITFG